MAKPFNTSGLWIWRSYRIAGVKIFSQLQEDFEVWTINLSGFEYSAKLNLARGYQTTGSAGGQFLGKICCSNV
ncbi:MAG: hypothetical protein ACTMUB_04185 [cyanobacterium endosymbiont of Rhopalodia musculus]|uniref:hypothetical protein n=1 Tax=cyanobacterium endosymbiont of Epithemia clementina EcSB TaxID=3034674 RepID=UPI002480ECFE|nr:hypothetical protein [cyanobacterium endosymbiont of Epithemia clementina EcSB]WGT67385.1 hypothetical protein P3F56_09330 [cyanobacterium endosymbiont of Epithemia clementina EcSB]